MSDALIIGKLQFHTGQKAQMTETPEPPNLLAQGAGLLHFCFCISTANLLKEAHG